MIDSLPTWPSPAQSYGSPMKTVEPVAVAVACYSLQRVLSLFLLTPFLEIPRTQTEELFGNPLHSRFSAPLTHSMESAADVVSEHSMMLAKSSSIAWQRNPE